VNGIVGKRCAISLNTVRLALILRWYDTSSARLYSVVAFSSSTRVLPSPPLTCAAPVTI